MSRRDILRALKNSKNQFVTLETDVKKDASENGNTELADQFKDSIAQITQEISYQRQMSAPIKSPGLFDRLHSEKIGSTRAQKENQRKEKRQASLHNFLWGHDLSKPTLTRNPQVPFVGVRHRAASVPPLEPTPLYKL